METLVTKTAGDLALQGSGWACAVILGIWSFYLFKQLRDCDKRVADLLEKVIVVAEASKTAAQGNIAALKDAEATVASVVTAVQTLSREQEGELREVRHGLANLLTIAGAIAGNIQQLLSRGRE